MRTSSDIRRTFIEFFGSKGGQSSGQPGHVFVPSAPVVPHDDPTLLFTNAGMNQFKKVFLNQIEPGSPLQKVVTSGGRAVNSQKCIRAGGKHNDLEDVGKDTYHHTFFEMLGNWSFGDYFKADAIAWAWELLTEVYQIMPDRLYATYFEGDESQGLEPDNEARQLWLRHLPPERVIPGDTKDNFWEMGETGPCGPCSEIHYDRIGGRNAAALVNKDDSDVIEVWNLVFIQFDRQADRSLKSLPAKHVDTGMGLERLVSVLQNARSNYDTDLFSPLFEAIRRNTRAPREYSGRLGDKDKGQVDTAYRVIADHARTLTFAITDGATPSNEGRGYVLRRVLRRAVRFGRQMLGAETGFFSGLVPVVVEQMGDAFTELKENPERVQEILLEEEESFGRTLDRGIKLFDEAAAHAEKGVITGADAFQLYDTFGFPLDLTELMAHERGLRVDTAGFEKHMSEQRERSRAGAKAGDDSLTLDPDALEQLRDKNIARTDDSHKFDPAHGMVGRLKAIWNGKKFETHASASGAGLHKLGLVLDRTTFYAEMGGQIADTGRIIAPGCEFKVETTKSFGGYVLHIGRINKGKLAVGAGVELHLDEPRRRRVEANHTSTHLLNLGLRKAFGQDADQKGSLVADDRLRFDFAHSGPMTPKEIAATDQTVRTLIDQDLTVYTAPTPLEQARAINGLRAVFGETYPDPVRVVSIGEPVEELLDSPSADAWREISVEFCGGTHVKSTSAIGAFAIISETGVAKGVRRVEALTGAHAEEAIGAADTLESRIEQAGSLESRHLPNELSEISAAIDRETLPLVQKKDLQAALEPLQARAKAAKKEAAAAVREHAVEQAAHIADGLEDDDNVVVTSIDAGGDREALQAAVQAIQTRRPESAVMLFDDSAEKVAFVASSPKGLIERGLKAGDWIRHTAPTIGGKGGGKPDNAQGAGSDRSAIHDAIRVARAFANDTLASG